MVSIIIPLKSDQGYLKRCIEGCMIQSGAELEIIVLPDTPLAQTDLKVIQEVTGSVSPAKKRNRGAQISRGDILAFIDDDTCPQPGWLEAALKHFDDPKIAAVGGPSVTPSQDPFWAQVSGAAYESWMLSGPELYRYIPTQPRDVQDFPSCNLLVRRSAFEEIKGFGTNFWPGEDTEFCLSLIKKGFRIRYEPKAVIDHHRRPSLKKHLTQIANYGLHRGYFAKRFPETSRRPAYFLPSLVVVLGFLLSISSILGDAMAFRTLLFLGIVYFLLIGISLLHKPFKLLIPAAYVILLSHIFYGLSFIRGLLSHQLPEEK